MKVGKGVWRIASRLYVSVVPDVPMIKLHKVTAVACVVKRGTPQDVVEAVYPAYFQTTIADGAVVYEDQFWEVAGWIADRRAEGHTVLVHCIGGRNRSVLAAVLSIVVTWRREGRTVTGGGETLLIGARNERPNSIANPAFEAWLKEMK